MQLVLLQATPTPVSAYLLCYFPLALVVLGLITWFVITDRHASRPYVRFNPFVAATTPQAELEQRPPTVGETPAGPLGAAPTGTTMVTLGELGDLAAVAPEAVPPPMPDPGRTPGEALPAMPEDLCLLSQPMQQALDTQKKPPVAPTEQGAATAAAPTAHAIAISFIEYDPPGDDLQGEYVLIKNGSADAIDLAGWRLHDQSDKHTYTFPSFVLPAGAEVRLWSKSGTNDAANLYWASRRPVWNNSGDTAFLLDASGNEISRYSYSNPK